MGRVVGGGGGGRLRRAWCGVGKGTSRAGATPPQGTRSRAGCCRVAARAPVLFFVDVTACLGGRRWPLRAALPHPPPPAITGGGGGGGRSPTAAGGGLGARLCSCHPLGNARVCFLARACFCCCECPPLQTALPPQYTPVHTPARVAFLQEVLEGGSGSARDPHRCCPPPRPDSRSRAGESPRTFRDGMNR